MAPSRPLQPAVFPSFRSILLTAVLCILLGFGGLTILLTTALPDLRARWLFYFLILVGVTGLFLPMIYFLNWRFMSSPPATGAVIVREGIWFGIYASILVWLQQGRVLSSILAIILALVFMIVEVLLRVRETAQWRPKDPES